MPTFLLLARRRQERTASEGASGVPAMVCQISTGEGYKRGGKSAASLGSQVSLISLAPVLRQKSKEIK